MEDFYIEKRVYYHDTDAGGVVYYANYLKHFEEGRVEYYYQRGIDLKELAREGTYFVVASVTIEYKSPARYGDTIKIATSIEKIGAASIHFLQKILKDNTVLVEAKIILVCVDKDFKPKTIPEETKQKMR